MLLPVMVTYQQSVMEQSCDWLHLFGGHAFDLLSTGRAKCAWVPSESHNTWKKQSQKPHIVRHHGSWLTGGLHTTVWQLILDWEHFFVMVTY